jgi:hypothetical protein
VSLDAGRGLAAPPELAGDPTQNETTSAYGEIEVIDNDKIVNVVHRCAPFMAEPTPATGLSIELWATWEAFSVRKTICFRENEMLKNLQWP